MKIVIIVLIEWLIDCDASDTIQIEWIHLFHFIAIASQIRWQYKFTFKLQVWKSHTKILG